MMRGAGHPSMGRKHSYAFHGCIRLDIHRRNRACGRQAPESDGAGGHGVGLSPCHTHTSFIDKLNRGRQSASCHQLVHAAVFPGYSESVLRTVSDFLWAQLANQLIPTNLNKCNEAINLNHFNNRHNDNNRNYINNYYSHDSENSILIELIF
jgi:hypothetical protein